MELVLAVTGAAILYILFLIKKPKPKSKSAARRGSPASSDTPDYVQHLNGSSTPRSEWMPEWHDALRRYLGREYTEEEEKAYRAIFGDNSLSPWKLAMYGKVAAAGTNCVQAKKDNYYRPLFEHFVTMRIMSTGYSIPPKLSLPALTVDDLRQMADTLKAGLGRSKVGLIDSISKFSDSDVSRAFDRLNTKMSDLFLTDLASLEIRVKSQAALTVASAEASDNTLEQGPILFQDAPQASPLTQQAASAPLADPVVVLHIPNNSGKQ